MIALLLAPCAFAFAPHRARLPARARRAAAPSLTMRYSIRDRKIRSTVNRLVYSADTIEDLAEVMGHRYMDVVGLKMGKHLLVKIRHKAQLMGYDIGYLDDDDDDLMDELAEQNVDLSKPVDLDAFYDGDAQSAPPAAPVEAEPLSIAADVDARVKAAMKARDKVLTSTLRLIKTALAAGAKDEGLDALGDDAAVKVLRKMAKMRQESIAMYRDAGESGAERLAAEEAELAVIEQWLPALADEATTRKWIQALIDAADGAPLNPGKMMGALMKDHREEIDGKLARTARGHAPRRRRVVGGGDRAYARGSGADCKIDSP
ncbi:Yqey-like protein [Aureococcus anophagefferens]|nr:Yqey-like protein [Aureococcus anophagefferens]